LSTSTYEELYPGNQEPRFNSTTPIKNAEAIPAIRTSSLSSSTCPSPPLPNLILSVIDGLKWQDQIFIFMQSLEVALGRESLFHHNHEHQPPHRQPHQNCLPAEVIVKIITPPSVALNPPDSFKALLRRYPNLEFVGALPDTDIDVVLRRFQGFSTLVSATASSYARILLCDLDVVFQRNPFAMPLKPGVSLLYFAEWRSMKIGQCHFHARWFDGCARAPGGPFITPEQIAAYNLLDRICAGTVYGTAAALAVYLRTMAAELTRSGNQCNDQALHIHLFYSGLLGSTLAHAGLGRVWVVPNEEALLGTVGTTPIVRFNEWGEMLNELGDVQHVVHQYKLHHKLSQIVWNRYGWLAELAASPSPAPLPPLMEDLEWRKGVAAEVEMRLDKGKDRGTDNDKDKDKETGNDKGAPETAALGHVRDAAQTLFCFVQNPFQFLALMRACSHTHQLFAATASILPTILNLALKHRNHTQSNR
jgi:hypothetical protein